MSLESVEQKIRNTGKIPLWKFIVFFGLVPATSLLAIFAVLLHESPLLDSIDEGIYYLAMFSSFFIFMTFFVLIGLLVTVRGLIKLNNGIIYRHGVFTGHALSTNDSFLRNFANAILPKIIGIIKGYNDPRFEELELKENQHLENERLYINQNLRFKDELKKKDDKINNLETKIKTLESRINELEKDKEEKDQIISKKFQAENKDAERK